ncbi:MAG: phage tail tip lysozyme [Candidatus Saccharimonadales bacterium]
MATNTVMSLFNFKSYQRAILLLIALIFTVSTPVQATSYPYRLLQDQLWYNEEDCDSGEGAASAVSTGDGGGCGEQGYHEGKESQANKQQVWAFFKSKGLSDVATAGILGNAMQESRAMPDADNGKSMNFAHASTGSGCIGLLQWCDRAPGLRDFAKERGKEWNCLGVQLEWAWYEMTETAEKQVMEPLKAAKTPGEAAMVFARIYERPGENEYAGRDTEAGKVYKEFTGKDAGGVGSSSTVSSGAECPSDGGAGIMSEDCAALVQKYKSLRGSKLTETVEKDIDQDLENCTTNPVQCGIPGGSGGGVHPKLLRAVIAAVENSGGEKVRVWNINTRHPCDGLNHPNGKASDLYCHIPSMSNRGEGPSADKCLRIFKYLYDHYDELGLSELIWNENTPFSKIGDGKHLFVDGHADHIHIGVKS